MPSIPARRSRIPTRLTHFARAAALDGAGRHFHDNASRRIFRFNTAKGSDATTMEVRWPYWAEHTYNALYSQA